MDDVPGSYCRNMCWNPATGFAEAAELENALSRGNFCVDRGGCIIYKYSPAGTLVLPKSAKFSTFKYPAGNGRQPIFNSDYFGAEFAKIWARYKKLGL